MAELLLELLSEEIPARMQGQAARDLARLFGERLAAAGLAAEELRTFAGPRRLTLVCELPAATADAREEIKGPKASAPAQALEGFLRKTGLAREQLVERDGVLFAVIERPGRATPEIAAEAAEAVVRGFPWPKSMRWGDGTLRWVRPLKRLLCLFDGAVVPFRITDGSPELGGRLPGIESGDATEGHRFLGTGRPLKVRDFADYRRQLEANFVLIDAEARKARILERATALCAEAGLELVPDDGLMEEVAGLAEWPTPILGEMDAGFLDLPPEVIRTSMRTHQKYFAVRSADLQVRMGAADPADLEVRAPLAPHFVVVSNIEPADGGALVAAGNARVLSARLNDARFFWDEDRKAGAVEGWLERLKGVTFHAKLGTLAERVERIAALAREIAPLVGADAELAEVAARLSKADLASAMVGEFPELQGVMGGYYVRGLPTSSFDKLRMRSEEGAGGASADGGSVGRPDTFIRPHPEPVEGRGRSISDAERDQIADAVRDHYRPQGPGDAVPTAPLTVAVALADKLDTLVGFFAVDEKPTGSKDPYALRRAALGMIRVVLANNLRFDLVTGPHMQTMMSGLTHSIGRIIGNDFYAGSGQSVSAIISEVGLEAVNTAAVRYLDPSRIASEITERTGEVLLFLAKRLEVALRDRGMRYDLVDAVFATGDEDFVRLTNRIVALGQFLDSKDGANLLAGYRRAANILRAEGKKNPDEAYDGDLQADLMVAPEEAALSAALTAASVELGPRLEAEDFAGAMGALSRLRGPVDAFFEGVLVNDPDPAVRLNRLRLLARVQAEMGRVADFSAIVG